MESQLKNMSNFMEAVGTEASYGDFRSSSYVTVMWIYICIYIYTHIHIEHVMRFPHTGWLGKVPEQ